jgi:hypothetical protein
MDGHYGHCRRLALALVFFLGLAPDASAETVAQTVRKWGLIGPWALDCSIPPDRGKGALLIYEVKPGGRVVHRRNFGDAKDENEVLSAVVSDNGILHLRVQFTRLKETREYGMIKQPGGTLRAMYNRNAQDEYTVKDGKFTANGNQSPWQHKCK